MPIPIGKPAIRLGTRGSPLALVQAQEVRRLLLAAHGWPEEAVAITVIRTSGDRIQDRPLSEAGGKGLFTKEIEEALIADEIDIAVHSMKDVPTALPEGLTLAVMLPREDVRDALISLQWRSLDALPHGARIGSSSLRRQAQLKRRRPDFDVVLFRGNVATRLHKLEEGEVAATLLAVAGLNRLGLANRIADAIAVETMLPAVAQGAIGIEARAGDDRTLTLVAPLDHQPTSLCVTAERAYLARLEGSCRTPIAGLGELIDGAFRFRGEVLSPDGREHHAIERQGKPAEAVRIAFEAAEFLASRAGHLVGGHA